MEIRFCDLCNESVPQSDIERGLAFLRGDRVVCANCDAAMGGISEGETQAQGAARPKPAPTPMPAPASAPPVMRAHVPARNGPAIMAGFLAVVAILLVAGVTLFLGLRLEEARSEVAGELSDQRLEFAGELRAERAERERLLAALGERIDRAGSDLREDAQREAGRMDESLAAMRTTLESVNERLHALSRHDVELERQREDLDGLRSAVDQLQIDVGQLARGLLEVEQRSPSGFGLAQPTTPEPAAPAWAGLVEELESTNAGERWSAVQALGETRDERVVAYLIPMLQDEDIFVRMATARIFGDLESVDAVPSLIEALADEEAPVREASVSSLRLITGKNFRFDPMASQSERERRRKAWREWWENTGRQELGQV